MRTKKLNEDGLAHIIIAFLALIVLGFIIFAGYKVLNNKQDTQAAIGQSSSPDRVISTVKASLSSSYHVGSSSEIKQSKEIAFVKPLASSVTSKPAGYNFFTIDDHAASLAIDYYNANLSLILQSITSSLKDQSFSLVDKANTLNYYEQVYKTNTLTCSLTSGYPIDLACVRNENFQAIAKAVKPFVDAYSGDSATTGFGMPVISNSKTPGYQLASVTIEGQEDGGSASFYRKVNQNWQYFGVEQAVPNCSSYTTSIELAAYKGQSCLTGESNNGAIYGKVQ